MKFEFHGKTRGILITPMDSDLTPEDETILVMSEAAYASLTKEQLKKLNKHNDHLLGVAIPTIEKIGGGSARCMLAEVYLPELD